MPRLYYNVSYTYSRLYGNWAGLANSDENGRSDPNVSRAFDLSQGNFDFSGQNVYGRLATDRPHTLKLFGNYTLDSPLGSTSIGLQQIAYSGTPISSEVATSFRCSSTAVATLAGPDALTQTDLMLSHGFRIGGIAPVRRRSADAEPVQPECGHQHHLAIQPERHAERCRFAV